MIVIAILLTPVLSRLRLRRQARHAFAAMMISLGAYLAWISRLLFNDEVGHINYSPELWVIRCFAVFSATWFLIAAIRCRWNVN